MSVERCSTPPEGARRRAAFDRPAIARLPAPAVRRARFPPLHWAPSSDDVDVAEALIAAGADVEAPGGSIGTPVENAVGYGCWRVARLLVQRGARVDKLWVAAGLGMLARIEELLRGASAEDINNAFWQSCHGGQRRAAELLRAHGADLNWVPDYAKSTPLNIAGGPDTGREALLTWLREQGAQPAGT